MALSHEFFDITSFTPLEITEGGCEILVNAVGMMGINPCEQNPERAFAVNSIAVKNLSRICQQEGMILVQPSTHAIFTGSGEEELTEESTPLPTNTYGISRYASEFFARQCERNYIPRFPALFGPRRNNPVGFIDKLPEMLKQGEAVKAATDRFDSFSYSVDVAGKIIDLVEEKAPFGVYHLANEGFPSFYEFATEMRDLYGSKSEITSVIDSAFSSLAAKPKDAKMSSIKTTPLRAWREALRESVGEDAKER